MVLAVRPNRPSFPLATILAIAWRHDDSLKFKTKHSSRTDQSTDTPYAYSIAHDAQAFDDHLQDHFIAHHGLNTSFR